MHWHRLPKTHRLALGFLPTVPSTPLTMKNQPPAPEPSLRSVVPAYSRCYRVLRKGRGSPVNVALHLIKSLSTGLPADPLRAPHPNRPQVFFRRKPNREQSNLKIPMLSPLCFHGLTNCFSRKPFIFKNICVAPRVYPPKPSSRRTTTSTCRPRPPILFIIKQLRTLVLSCSSFSHSHPLFSMGYGLFCKNRGVGTLCSPSPESKKAHAARLFCERREGWHHA
jgi:hypothetical protein